ncbi:MAG: cell division protein FtsQ/DivIB, partial [Candidatus Oxydemutatoraceae bacterium WSBS_2016_MAG_OTU14]
LEQQLERAKWIKSVWIERIWPHTLSIKIEEREAIARWGEDTLIDSEGQLFKTEDGYTPSLPFVYGAVGREKFLLNEYYQMSQRLQTVNLSLYLLEESPRGFLYLVLNNGWHLHLGEKLWQERLQKFIVVYRTTLSQDSDALAKIKCLDFRYAYGFTTSTNSAECFT